MLAGVHQQTIIRWAEAGFVAPSSARLKYEPRRYNTGDTVAVLIAAKALACGMPREEVADLVEDFQRGDTHSATKRVDAWARVERFRLGRLRQLLSFRAIRYGEE